MATPWDLGAQFLQLMQAGAARDQGSADQMFNSVMQTEAGRQNAMMGHNLGLQELGVRNRYSQDAATVAHGRQLERDMNAFGQTLYRDDLQHGRRTNELFLRDDMDADNAAFERAIAERERAIAAREQARLTGGNIGDDVNLPPVPPMPQRARRYQPDATLVNTESGGNWGARNNARGAGGARGHYGRLQFGHARLQEAKAAGVIPKDMTPQQFMQSPQAQERTEQWHFNDIDQHIRKQGLDRYIGQEIGGTTVTLQGLRNMAHLGGKGGMTNFLRTGGRHNPADTNGTRLSDYLAMGASSGGARSQQAGVGAGSTLVDQMALPDMLEQFHAEPVQVQGLGPIMNERLGTVGRDAVIRAQFPNEVMSRLKDSDEQWRSDWHEDLDLARAGKPGYFIYAPPKGDGERVREGMRQTQGTNTERRLGAVPETTRVEGPQVEIKTGAGRFDGTARGGTVQLTPPNQQRQ